MHAKVSDTDAVFGNDQSQQAMLYAGYINHNPKGTLHGTITFWKRYWLAQKKIEIGGGFCVKIFLGVIFLGLCRNFKTEIGYAHAQKTIE